MNKPIYVKLTAVKLLRPLIVVILLVFTGRTFNAKAQTVTILHSFVGSPTDGNFAEAILVQGSDGNFYGTTVNGGMTGEGTLFRIGLGGTYTNLYSFAIDSGAESIAGLVQGSDGNFYGTTTFLATVFRFSPDGSYTNMHFFNANDGSLPEAGLVQGIDGNLYGTTALGGTNNHGIVFRISLSGNYTNLYNFGSFPNDGTDPTAELVQGSDGNLYGTTPSGGMSNQGTVFRISPSGSYTNLYSFGGSPTDGFSPEGGLVQGSDGNFYGTTTVGGTSTNCSRGCGTIFRITSTGNYTNLYSFIGPPNDGSDPTAGLVQGSDGNFYGTTYFGGINNSGTVFRLSIPLNPPSYPINQITRVQLSGKNVVFNIPSIAYETYQLQFSNSMIPTNWVNISGVFMTNSIGGLLTLTNFGGASQTQGFYRFDITP